MAAIREAQNRALAGSKAGDAAPETVIGALVNAAGGACASAVALPEERREDWEVFYSCPSATAAAFFVALGATAEGCSRSAMRGEGGAAAELDTLTQAAQAAQVPVVCCMAHLHPLSHYHQPV